jgi:hypothetical protein
LKNCDGKLEFENERKEKQRIARGNVAVKLQARSLARLPFARSSLFVDKK